MFGSCSGANHRGSTEIVVRDEHGDPVVLRNAPLLDDGTPMPTRYWLIGPSEIRRVGQLEADGGVNAAEAEIDPTSSPLPMPGTRPSATQRSPPTTPALARPVESAGRASA